MTRPTIPISLQELLLSTAAMKISFFKILPLFIILSCNNSKEDTTLVSHEENQNLEITESDISKIKYTDFTLDKLTRNAVTEWNEYHELDKAVTNVKKGDLSFFLDNKKVIDELFKNLLETIPTEVNSPAILARINAFKTKFYKLEDLVNLDTKNKTHIIGRIEELLVAFSNFNLQMNKKTEFDNQVIEKPY